MGCKCMRNIINEEESELKSSVKKKNNNKNIIKANFPSNIKKEYYEDNTSSNILPKNNEDKSEISSFINQNLQEEKSITIKNSSITNKCNISNNIIVDNNNLKDKNIEYNERLLTIINEIRENPPLFANKIENSLKNIIIEKKIIKDETTGIEKEKVKIVYKDKLKIALYRGEPAFLETIKILKNTDSINPLEINNNIIIPLPEFEAQTKDSSYLKSIVKEMRKNVNIDIYYKDLIKDPEISALLMVVDDNNKNAGKKRDAILNKDYKYIGISSKFYKNSFVAFLSFSK